MSFPLHHYMYVHQDDMCTFPCQFKESCTRDSACVRTVWKLAVLSHSNATQVTCTSPPKQSKSPVDQHAPHLPNSQRARWISMHLTSQTVKEPPVDQHPNTLMWGNAMQECWLYTKHSAFLEHNSMYQRTHTDVWYYTWVDQHAPHLPKVGPATGTLHPWAGLWQNAECIPLKVHAFFFKNMYTHSCVI
jgi:hypothetical protein